MLHLLRLCFTLLWFCLSRNPWQESMLTFICIYFSHISFLSLRPFSLPRTLLMSLYKHHKIIEMNILNKQNMFLGKTRECVLGIQREYFKKQQDSTKSINLIKWNKIKRFVLSEYSKEIPLAELVPFLKKNTCSILLYSMENSRKKPGYHVREQSELQGSQE